MAGKREVAVKHPARQLRYGDAKTGTHHAPAQNKLPKGANPL